MSEDLTNTKKKKRFTERHTFSVSGHPFIVDKKYMPSKPIGIGAYGVVCSAEDLTTKRMVAIKKIEDAFVDLIDAKRILREIKVLHHLDHENVIKLVDLVNPLTTNDCEDVYIVLDYMDTDMHKIIYSKNKLSPQHCQYFLYQILRALKYIHSANIIHRDLICDFGLARVVGNTKDDNDLTEYVVTRWYRPPEVMCSSKHYDYKVDVWSAGCIFGELLGRQPLFPGENYIHQLNLMFETLGTPFMDDLEWITNEKALAYIKSLEPKPKTPLSKIYPNASELAIDLLEKMLSFNPNKRYSVDECLAHPYLKELHNPADEPICSRKIDFSWETDATTKLALQEQLFEEICAFRPEAAEINPLDEYF